MNKFFTKLLAGSVTLSLAASGAVLPMTASADYEPMVSGDTVLNEWKFYFGDELGSDYGDYTLVTPDSEYYSTRDADGKYYGFLGINEEDYKLGGRLDGFDQQEGQVITLEAGENGGVGSVGEDLYGNAGDEYYPVRFAMQVDDETYYRIKAEVTTLDPTADATASLYTERKHPLYTEKTIAAGETETTEFTIRVTPIYYQKSDPTGPIADGMVNVCVLGENTALLSLEIQQVETAPVFWVLGDSTVTDGSGTLPFFKLQNYTGVGTGFTKYLPSTIAMVNEGEGGLAANDSLHYNMVVSRIKSGDYMYVEYGHNHKSDGVSGYLSCLDNYYKTCKSAGATLILGGPIDRVQTSQYDSSTNTWTQTLQGFSTAAKAYVDLMLHSGESAAAEYVSLYNNSDTSAADEYLAEELAKEASSSITNVAYFDMNAASLAWYTEQSASGMLNGSAVENSYLLTHFYFQTSKGGGADTTHPNDAGAENLAYLFFEQADTDSYPALKPLLANFEDGAEHEVPTVISSDITNGGLGGTAWPTYIVPTSEKYPVVINDIQFDDDGYAVYAKVTTQAAETLLSTYGIIVITVYDSEGNEKGNIYSVDQVDNSTSYGVQEIKNFTTDVTLGEDDTYTAVVLEAADTGSGLTVVDGGTVYSAVYTPTDVEEQLLLNEELDGYENFDFYSATYDGATSLLTSFNSWEQAGSAGITTYLNETDDFKYAEITSDGAKNGSANQGSFYLAKQLAKSIDGVGGKYLVSADMQFVSGGGMTFNLDTVWSSSNVGKIESTELFTIGDSGAVTIDGTEAGTISATGFTNVKYILDTDRGTASITVGGGDAVTVDIDTYQTLDPNADFPVYTYFMFGGSKVAFDVKVANLQVAKLKDETLPTYGLTVSSSDDSMGTVAITYAEEEEEETENDETAEASLSDYSGVFTLAYNDGNAVVTASEAAEAVLIEAQYADGGALSKAVTTELTFTEAGSQTVAVDSGSKLMLWDSVSGMVPLADTVMADDTVEPDVVLTLNTVVTLTATANDGYVFEKWVDQNGSSVSTDSVYSFRLREDTSLIASFAEQGGVEDVTSFSVTADNSFIKTGTEQTVNFAVEDVADASGNAVEYSDSDVSWSVDDSGVSLSGGVLTIPADYDMGDDIEKEITVSAVINNITKSCSVTVHCYDYSEDFSDVSDSTWGFSGVGGATVTGGYLSLLASSSANTVGTMTKTLDSEIAAASKVVLKFDWQSLIESGKGRHSNFVLADADGNTIFGLRGAGSGGLYYSTTLSETTNDDTFVSFSSFNQNWYTVSLTLDFAAGTMSGTISNTSTGAVVATIAETAIPNSAANLGTLYAVNTYSLAPMAIDNFMVKLYS